MGLLPAEATPAPRFFASGTRVSIFFIKRILGDA